MKTFACLFFLVLLCNIEIQLTSITVLCTREWNLNFLLFLLLVFAVFIHVFNPPRCACMVFQSQVHQTKCLYFIKNYSLKGNHPTTSMIVSNACYAQKCSVLFIHFFSSRTFFFLLFFFHFVNIAFVTWAWAWYIYIVPVCK